MSLKAVLLVLGVGVFDFYVHHKLILHRFAAVHTAADDRAIGIGRICSSIGGLKRSASAKEYICYDDQRILTSEANRPNHGGGVSSPIALVIDQNEAGKVILSIAFLQIFLQ